MTDKQNDSVVDILDEVDEPTILRAASLSAKNLLDGQIADILLLTMEQMTAVKSSQIFKKKYAEEANEIIDAQIARSEGWDALEDEALAELIKTLRFNKDPKFLLAAAATANRAERRKRAGSEEVKVIDASQQTNNVIILTMNRNYIQQSGESRQLDITPRPTQIPLKQSDIPAPKLVDSLLAAPVEKGQEMSATNKQLSDIEKMAKAAGIVFDEG